MNCIHCKQTDLSAEKLLCRPCLKQLYSNLLSRSYSEFYYKKTKLISFGLYNGPLATLVKAGKSQPFGQLPSSLWNITQNLCRHWANECHQADFICHVPGQPFRCLIETDFADSIASCLSAELKIPHYKRLLRRRWLSKEQKSKTAQERKEIEKNKSFYINSNIRATKKMNKIILVDDVCATGASLEKCSELLRTAGFEVTQWLSFARSERFFYEYKYGKINEDHHRAFSNQKRRTPEAHHL